MLLLFVVTAELVDVVAIEVPDGVPLELEAELEAAEAEEADSGAGGPLLVGEYITWCSRPVLLLQNHIYHVVLLSPAYYANAARSVQCMTADRDSYLLLLLL